MSSSFTWSNNISWYEKLRIRVTFLLIPKFLARQIAYEQHMARQAEELMTELCELKKRHTRADEMFLKVLEVGGEGIVQGILNGMVEVTEEKVWKT